MHELTLNETRSVSRDTEVLGAWMPVPGFGVLPVNAYLIRAAQPVLVDTGLAATRHVFLERLGEAIDPVELRWIWITHADADHLGNLKAVLEIAPLARVVTTYLGMGKMGMQGLPLDRMYLLNPGQQLDAGDRCLTAIVPPTFDAPETCGVHDSRSGALFSADSFGALLQAPVENAAEIPPHELEAGCLTWASVDSPWLHGIDPDRYQRSLDVIRRLECGMILGSHLPPARDMTDRLLGYLARAPQSPPFCGPDQAAMDQLLAA